MKHLQVRLDLDGMTPLSRNVLRRRLAEAGRIVFLLLLAPYVVAQASLPYTDPSHHTSKMISVEKDVQVEVLDWGGAGEPIILLAGMGNTAHIWDDFAPKLTSAHHVCAITRRGYGISIAPLTGYSADRLGDDVVAVMDQLGIERPVLIGHSLGGEELSSIGSRHPERISALIYLKAGYSYAYYDSAHGDYNVDLAVLRRELDTLAGNPSDLKRMEPAEADLPVLQKDLEAAKAAQKLPPPFHVCPPSPGDLANFAAMRIYMAGRLGGSPPESELHQTHITNPDGTVGPPSGHPFVSSQVFAGYQRYTNIPAPVLAIYASPHDYGSCKTGDQTPTSDKAFEANNLQQIHAFEPGLPTARVVRISGANHYIFISNHSEVLKQIQDFLTGLP